jgi:hypothetical protein
VLPCASAGAAAAANSTNAEAVLLMLLHVEGGGTECRFDGVSVCRVLPMPISLCLSAYAHAVAFSGVVALVTCYCYGK